MAHWKVALFVDLIVLMHFIGEKIDPKKNKQLKEALVYFTSIHKEDCEKLFELKPTKPEEEIVKNMLSFFSGPNYKFYKKILKKCKEAMHAHYYLIDYVNKIITKKESDKARRIIDFREVTPELIYNYPEK